MRLGRVDSRLSILRDDRAIDVESASSGRFGPDPEGIFANWDPFIEWAGGLSDDQANSFDPAQLGAPVVNPRQVFGIALNYVDHAAESGVAVPKSPAVFTKFSSCLTGPYDAVVLPSANVDWEVELVVVIGRHARHVSEADAWSYVAGVTVGQDLSERTVQLQGPVPQFSLGKSFPGFGPIGPWMVTTDELSDPDDLALSCRVGSETLQQGRTKDMVFAVPELIARLSAVCPLLPGDLVFTGTPPGVGMGRKPQRYLVPDSTLVSEIVGIGELRNPLVAATPSVG